MARFAAALEQHPAPRTLGDVSLRYEPSMLIAETPKPRRTWRPTAAWLVGFSALLVGVGLFLLRVDPVGIIGFVALGALGLLGATWLEQLDKRRRRFVANFGTTSLRLDFTSPIAGRPRTIVVHFDQVRAVDLVVQADGAHCLTVDFVPTPGSAQVLREVLVAYVPTSQLDDAARLHRVLQGAFGLGEVPADSPAFDESTFEAGTSGPTR
jgi:hypothetical protein